MKGDSTLNNQIEVNKQNAELMTQIISLLADNNLTIKQGADLLETAKVQMMHHTKLSHNFNDLIKEAVILEQIHQEVKF